MLVMVSVFSISHSLVSSLFGNQVTPESLFDICKDTKKIITCKFYRHFILTFLAMRTAGTLPRDGSGAYGPPAAG